jgi:hypothetical protein
MLRLLVTHSLENINVSRNSEFHVGSLPVKLCRHHKLVLMPDTGCPLWPNLTTAKSSVWTHGLHVAASAEVMSFQSARGQTKQNVDIT